MRFKLQLAAAALAFVSAVVWFFGGPNFGWTKTTVTHMLIDPVTELEYPQTERRFLPGIDFLAACWIFAAAIAGSSLLIRRR